MGRHAGSDSDGPDQGHASLIAGLRRNDVPDALWRGAAAEVSEHPTQAGRDRSDRRRDGLLPAGNDPRRPSARPVPGPSGADVRPREDARQLSRSRLPLPPVPASSRGAAPAPRAAAQAGPLTTAAPFRAVPSPEPRPGILEVEAFGPSGAPSPSGRSSRPARTSGPSVPRPKGADEVPSAAFEEWTPAARAFAPSADLAEPAGDLLVRPAPATTAIPERSVSRRGRSARVPGARASAAVVEPEAPAEVSGPGTGPVGGRAAMRAERQAVDMARRKAVRRSGGSTSALPADDEDEPRRPRRVVRGLAAMAVVGLGVLGVYTYVSPQPQDAVAQSPAVTSTVPTPGPPSDLPALATEPVAASPVRVPVTVLNSTDTTGLAAKVAAAVAAGGWETPAVGGYTAGDVAASTVFFTEGDENQRQAALQLIEMFPQLQGPTPRFFELPADVDAPGLVVVTTGDWQP